MDYEWGWAIGILEGEGCFRVHHQRGRQPGWRSYGMAQVQINMTDRDILDRLISIVQLGSITGPYRNGPKPNHKEVWHWRVSGSKAAVLMVKVYPYMGARRRARIEEIAQELGMALEGPERA